MRHFRTLQDKTTGRWLVVHDTPGGGIPAVDADCLTQGAAVLEAFWLEAERNRKQRELADEQQLLGLRRGAA